MIGLQRTKHKASERGIALVVALLTLLLISALLMGMIVASNSETNISANFRDEQTAFFAARAGIEEVRDRMRPNAISNGLALTPYFTTAPTPLPGAPGGVLYVTNPANGETVAPWLTNGSNYPDDEICKEVTCVGGVPTGAWYLPAQSAGNGYAAVPVLPWKWVRVMVKPNKSDTGGARITSVDGLTNGNLVCFNGTNEHTTAATSCPDKPVYELTALAVTKSGSRRMVQYEISQNTLPPIPGAIVFDGPTPNFGTNPNSAAFGVTGTDTHTGPTGAQCPAAVNEPGLGGFNAASTTGPTGLQGQVNRPGSYTGSPSGIADVSSQLGPLSTVDGLNALVSSVTSMAGTNVYGPNPLPNPSTLNPGTLANPVINVVQGDYTMPSSGSGIILVTGTLTMNGNPSFNGLILVIGKGSVQKNGGGNGTLDGSLLVANLYSDPPAYTHLIPSGAPGIPTIAWNGGGNATVQYDSCWSSSLSKSLPYRTITDRELIY